MALTPADIKALREELLKNLKVQEEMNVLSQDYTKLIKKIKELNTDINVLQEEAVKQRIKEADARKTLNKALAIGNQQAIDDAQELFDKEEARVKLLDDEIKQRKDIVKLLAQQAKTSAKVGAIIKTSLDDIKKTGAFLKKAYNFLELTDVFKMSKSIKVSAMQMGVLSNQADSFSKDIQAAALNTIEYGLGINEIAEMQSTFSDELGRTVMLGAKGAEAMGQMAVATGLGAEGAANMAANMDMLGYSVERAAEYVEQVMNDAHSMGVNSGKIIKNIQQNIKLLNRYNFKNGVKGLASMAESAAKLNVDMNLVNGMADKLFDIEGAVDMSAQLQVMGGEWAKLADPFKLMYMARNDMDALFKSVVNATKGVAQFNKETGEFDISALEMHRLRKIADETGLSFEELTQAAKNAAKFTKIDGQIKFNVDDKTKEFIESTAKLGKDGKATIRIDNVDKLISSLSDSDKKRLTVIANEKENMKQRAKDSITLNELLGNTVIMFKQLLVPLVDALNNRLRPSLDAMITKLKDPKFIDGIVKFTAGIGEFIGGIGKFIIEWPKLSAGLFVLFEASKWYASGMVLGAGFNSVAAGGGGLLGGLGKMGGGSIGKGALIGGGLGLAGMGVGALTDAHTKEGSNMNILGKAAAGGLEGAAAGSLVGPWGAAIGGILGAAVGGISAYMKKPDNEKNINDGVVHFNDKDKFMKVNDSTMVAGTNENGNKDLARMLSGGNIPALANKDKFFDNSSKNNFNQNSNVTKPGNMTINFGELKLGGSVELKNGQGVTSELGKQLLNTPSFIRELTKLIHIETSSAHAGPIQQRVAN